MRDGFASETGVGGPDTSIDDYPVPMPLEPANRGETAADLRLRFFYLYLLIFFCS